ncbi:MAG: hypothetical protein JOZ18_16460 [Chloroflexi bacterium]|nr:hypothetical protein [Chloroflexota bacterium]
MSLYSDSEKAPPPLEMIGDLLYSPDTDIPFGKPMRIGLTEYTIYESAIEDGYQAGIQAHQLFLHDLNRTMPVALDDKQFTMIIKQLLPKDLSPFNKQLWRSFFIAGWMSICLGITIEEE